MDDQHTDQTQRKAGHTAATHLYSSSRSNYYSKWASRSQGCMVADSHQRPRGKRYGKSTSPSLPGDGKTRQESRGKSHPPETDAFNSVQCQTFVSHWRWHLNRKCHLTFGFVVEGHEGGFMQLPQAPCVKHKAIFSTVLIWQ